MKNFISVTPSKIVKQVGLSAYLRNYGLLATTHVPPRNAVEIGAEWACDNDCFRGLNPREFVALLHRAAGLPNCRFVAVPDVVGNARGTLRRFARWQPLIRRLGLPCALVGQDGLERLRIPWDDFDAFFIGGSTEWKLSARAAGIVAEARERGMWVHMGRVNSALRVQYAITIGCDSYDGSGFAKFSRQQIPRVAPLFDQHQLALIPGLGG